jgi:5-(aminomethyl)-3-furanmethanol phosphate kinase
MTACPVRVVKIGGSLFRFAAFVQAWDRWLAEQPPAVNVLIAGGGQLADVIRQADAAWGLGDEAAHWLCVDVLAVSARLVAATLKKARLETDWDRLRQSLEAGDGRQPIVFCPVQFLQQIEQRFPPQPLPHRWSVTSDSIAARIAGVLSADELVLLKSADPPAQAADQPPYVDRYFVTAAAGLNRVRFVNLRHYA